MHVHAQVITQPLIVLGGGGICNSQNIWTKKILRLCKTFLVVLQNDITPPSFWTFFNEGTRVYGGILTCLIFTPRILKSFFLHFQNQCMKTSQCGANAQSYCFLIQFSRPWNSSNNGTYIPQFSARRYKHYRIHNRSSQWNHIIKSLSMREGAYENGQMIRCLHLLWAHQHLVEIFFQICCKVSLRLESTIWGRMISPLAISSWNCH